ncbi:MAG: Conserved helix repeat-containing protein [Frankiales bacterium]|nr:Conserved helix repeat-containing protein [Frankiales bacterium]
MTAPLAVDFEGPVTDGFRTLATFVPKLLGFLVILLVGYVVARVVSTLVDKALEKAGFDRAVEKGGIKKALAKSQYDASDIVAKLVFFAVFIPFLSAAVGALGISALQQPLAQFIALIPKIIVAIVLVVVGAVLAGAVKSFIQNALGGLSYGKALATAASALILVSFVKSALDQVGVATTVTTPLLYTVLATVAGVTIVGAGGGLIKPMQHRWENVLTKAEVETQQVKARAQQQQYSQTAQPQMTQEQYAQQQYAQQQYAAQQQAAAPVYPADPAYQQQPTTQQQYGQR